MMRQRKRLEEQDDEASKPQVADDTMDEAIWNAMMRDDFRLLWENVGMENVNVQRKADGATPLMAAARYPTRTDELKVLLKLGSDISLKNWKKKTAMDYARASNNTEGQEILNPLCRDLNCLHVEDKLTYIDGEVVCTDCGLVFGSLSVSLPPQATAADYEDGLSMAMADMSLSQRSRNNAQVVELWEEVEHLRRKEESKELSEDQGRENEGMQAIFIEEEAQEEVEYERDTERQKASIERRIEREVEEELELEEEIA